MLANHTLPEVGSQRLPGVKTCTSPHRELRCCTPWKSPAGFVHPAAQAAHEPPSPPCCSQSLNEHGELSSLSARRLPSKGELNSQLLFKPCLRTDSRAPAARARVVSGLTAPACPQAGGCCLAVVLAEVAVCPLHGHHRVQPTALIHPAAAGGFS